VSVEDLDDDYCPTCWGREYGNLGTLCDECKESRVVTGALGMIAVEVSKHVHELGFDAAHDDRLVNRELLHAAVLILQDMTGLGDIPDRPDWIHTLALESRKHSPVRRMVMALALGVREVQRVARAEARGNIAP